MGFLKNLNREHIQFLSSKESNWFSLLYRADHNELFATLFSCSKTPVEVDLPWGSGTFEEILNTESKQYGGVEASGRKWQLPHRIVLAPDSAVVGKIF